MTQLCAHVYSSAIPDQGDTSLVQPSNWNDGHAFAGGTNGNPLVRDSTVTTYGAAWASKLVYAGGAAVDTLTIARGSVTAGSALALTATWTAGGTFPGAILANITDTSSNAASLLMDLQVGAVTKFNVRKDGQVTGAALVTSGGGVDLKLGGTTASFPALKRSSAILQARLADDSAYAAFDALSYAAGGVAGIDTTITTAGLVGKTITVTKGIVTGFA